MNIHFFFSSKEKQAVATQLIYLEFLYTPILVLTIFKKKLLKKSIRFYSNSSQGLKKYATAKCRYTKDVIIMYEGK